MGAYFEWGFISNGGLLTIRVTGVGAYTEGGIIRKWN